MNTVQLFVVTLLRLYEDAVGCVRLAALKIKWRQRNLHNETQVVRCFEIAKVSVGKASYGDLEVYGFGNDKECLNIGNYVSIAPGVKFILGGGHETNFFMLYPVRMKYLGKECEADVRGDIVVEDDAWIGTGATIISGVTVGRGSVVGAGAVVVRNIPPYSIAVGIPCRVIRPRFPEEVVRELMKVDLSWLEPGVIRENTGLFTTDLSGLSAEEVRALVEGLHSAELDAYGDIC